jgi:phosphatidylethanolamine/phosphatidyl-N-methylethanolamine N-methyltransferase
MARMTVMEDVEDLVVELGAGTGAVTEALLARGVPARQLIAIERSPALADLLRARFPGIRVVCGDAVHLRRLLRHLGTGGARINIVSSLPLRSLPPKQVHSILKEIGGVLRSGGRWIQFTYALVGRQIPRGFAREASSLVWRNLPPARVDVFARAVTV